MLPDYLEEGLKAVFVGTAAGERSASRGHYYSGRGNKFWELLWEAGLSGDRILIPEQDSRVLEYRIGLTDVAKSVAASSDTKLRASHYAIPALVEKIERFQPRSVAFNGKTAAKVVGRAFGQPSPDHGPARFRIAAVPAYVLPSSSGSNNDPRRFAPKATKAEWWREFGNWLEGSLE